VLIVYLAWLGVAAAGAIVAATSTTHLVLAWLAAVLGLGLVWRWVVGRESAGTREQA
jgi:hypothetical protein